MNQGRWVAPDQDLIPRAVAEAVSEETTPQNIPAASGDPIVEVDATDSSKLDVVQGITSAAAIPPPFALALVEKHRENGSSGQFPGFGNGVAHGKHQPKSGGV